MRSVAGDNRQHPEPEVEDVLHLVVGDVAGRLDLGEDARLLPRPRRTMASQCAGSTRARLPGMPPPVTCANACTSTCSRQLRASPARRSRSGAAARRRASGARPATRDRRGDGRRGRAAPGGRASSRCSAARGWRSRSTTSPGRTAAGRTSPRSTTPTANPTRSNSPGSMRSGCSDISPPSSAQPASRQPVRDAGDDLVDDLGHELADRDVVEEEQRLGALHRDVVDRHRDAVDADRVVATGEAGDAATSCRRRRSTRRAAGRSNGRGSNANSPPNPPMSPTTSGRNVERTCCLDQLDGLLARRDVDARVGVGERRRRRPVAAPRVIEASGGGRVGRGRRPRARASSRSSGTGTG